MCISHSLSGATHARTSQAGQVELFMLAGLAAHGRDEPEEGVAEVGGCGTGTGALDVLQLKDDEVRRRHLRAHAV